MSLYQLEKDGDVDALAAYLDSDTEAVRERAADSLGTVVDADAEAHLGAIDRLVDVACNDESPSVRGAAIDALDEVGRVDRLLDEMAGIDADDGADWVAAEAYVDALAADRPELRMAAANALAGLGEPRVVPALIDRLEDPDARVRARSARACGKLGDPRAVAALAGRLTDENVAVRHEAASALAAIGDDTAMSALLDWVDDDSDPVRRVVVSALGESGRMDAVDALVTALNDEASSVRRTAVYSIIELLSSVPTERSHDLRETVVDRLSSLDSEGIVGPMVEVLERSTRTAQRRNAAWLLGRLDGARVDETVDALVDALDDDDQMVARFAATSLSELGGTAVEDALLAVLDGEASTQARAKAAFVLGKVGGDRAHDRLQELVQEADDEDVRERAFAALSKLGGQLEGEAP